MDDIIDRLMNYDTCHDGDIDEAADEIRNLRLEVNELSKELLVACEEIKRLYEENGELIEERQKWRSRMGLKVESDIIQENTRLRKLLDKIKAEIENEDTTS